MKYTQNMTLYNQVFVKTSKSIESNGKLYRAKCEGPI